MISDAVSLSDKLGREDRSLVPEEGAFHAGLSVLSEPSMSPHENSVPWLGAQNDLVARTNEEAAGSSRLARTVVPPEEIET